MNGKSKPTKNWLSLLSTILAILPVVLGAWNSEDSQEPSQISVRSDQGKGNLTVAFKLPDSSEFREEPV